MEDWLITSNHKPYLIATKKSTGTAVVISSEHGKTNMAVIQIQIIISFYLNFLTEI